MLKIIIAMSELNTEQLMAVYRESNLANCKSFYSDLTADEQLKKAETVFLSYLREDFFRQKNAVYAIWVVDGVYRSALRLEPYKDGLLLQALETAPDARRTGCAYKLMEAVIAFLRTTQWRRVYSHIEKRNTPSIGVHRKCGFKQISDSATYIDGTVTQSSATFCIEL